MELTTQAALVAALRAGGREAFAQVYETYKGDVLALVAAMLGRQEGAWDILHDVFVSLARQASSLDPNSNLKGYLLTAAANRARDFLAKRRPVQDCTGTVTETPCPCTNEPSEVVTREAEADRLRRAVETLPREQRMVVALHIYGSLTFGEIAQREGISENTAQSRYRYALDKLRQQWGKTGS